MYPNREIWGYVPNTVLEGDIRKKVKQADRIVLTYRKKRGEEKYSEIVYAAKKVDWNKIKLPQGCEYHCQKRRFEVLYYSCNGSG